MKLLKYHLITYLVIILFLSFTGLAQSPKSKGKYTRKIKEPVNAHILSELNEVKVKRVRGRLISVDKEVPPDSIVSLYKLVDGKKTFLFSYLVGAKGKFNFKKLKAGTYLLMTGTTDGSYNQVNIEIVLAPRDKDSLDEDLEIHLQVGT